MAKQKMGISPGTTKPSKRKKVKPSTDEERAKTKKAEKIAADTTMIFSPKAVQAKMRTKQAAINATKAKANMSGPEYEKYKEERKKKMMESDIGKMLKKKK